LKKIDLGQTIGIVANIGVIAGILFLAVELRQNNNLMIDEAERARAESRRQHWVLIAENAELAAMMVKERNGEQLNAAEELRLTGYWMRDLIGYQTAFQQLPREDLLAAGLEFRRFFETSPSFRAAWEEHRYSLDPNYVQFMDLNVLHER